MRLYGLLGGQVCIHVQSMYPCAKHVANYVGEHVGACGDMQGHAGTCGDMWGHASPGNFDFGPFIGCNLVESGTVFAQT